MSSSTTVGDPSNSVLKEQDSEVLGDGDGSLERRATVFSDQISNSADGGCSTDENGEKSSDGSDTSELEENDVIEVEKSDLDGSPLPDKQAQMMLNFIAEI